MEIIDTHAHLDLPDFRSEMDKILRHAKEAEVAQIVNVGFDLESSSKSASYAANYPQIFATVGIHPHDAKTWDLRTADLIRMLAGKDKVVAIGEIGLDFYRNLSDPKDQKKVFIEQIQMAKELNMPIVVHCRDAWGETMRIMEEHKPEKALLHCFSGDMIVARWAFDGGYLLSFGGSITYPKNEYLSHVIAECPDDLLLAETDCPYLAPVPLRGRRNEPAYIRHVIIQMANHKGTSIEKMAELTTKNARDFFGLPRN